MWPLLLFSILSVSCIIERIIFWNKINSYLKVSNDFQISQFTDISYLKSSLISGIGVGIAYLPFYLGFFAYFSFF